MRLNCGAKWQSAKTFAGAYRFLSAPHIGQNTQVVPLDLFDALSRRQAAFDGEPPLRVAEECEVESPEARHRDSGAPHDKVVNRLADRHAVSGADVERHRTDCCRLQTPVTRQTSIKRGLARANFRRQTSSARTRARSH